MKKQRQSAAPDTPPKTETEVSATAEQGSEAAQKNAGYVPPEAGIGDRIRKRREELGLTVEELSRVSRICDKRSEQQGLASSTIGRYEKHQMKPGAREIRILCESLGVSADWLVRGIQPGDMPGSVLSERATDALRGFLNIFLEEAGEDAFFTAIERTNRIDMARRPEDHQVEWRVIDSMAGKKAKN